MAEIARVKVNWDECGSLDDAKMPQFLVNLRDKTREAGKRLAGDCTYHYLPCETCPKHPGNADWAKVEVYCDDGGTGPEPDWWFCERC